MKEVKIQCHEDMTPLDVFPMHHGPQKWIWFSLHINEKIDDGSTENLSSITLSKMIDVSFVKGLACFK